MLHEIIEMKRKHVKVLPPKGAAVIHVRVGDVIDPKIDRQKYPGVKIPTASDFWERRTSSRPDLGAPEWSYYVLCVQEIKKKLSRLRRLGIKHIILVYGVYCEGDFPETRKYLVMYKLYCERKGFHVQLQTHSDADEAFVYVCSSTVFSPSGGGFSRLMSKIVQRDHRNIVVR